MGQQPLTAAAALTTAASSSQRLEGSCSGGGKASTAGLLAQQPQHFANALRPEHERVACNCVEPSWLINSNQSAGHGCPQLTTLATGSTAPQFRHSLSITQQFC
jgi:hypothetical protein